MHMRWVALLLAALLLLAACAGTDEQAAPAAADTEEAAAEAEPVTSEPAAPTSEPADGGDEAGSPTLATSDTELGTVLVDGEGLTLYVFDNDTDGISSCTGDCAANWPPLTGEVTVGDGVDESLLGTTERDDGSQQVTYAEQPLYYFAGDQAAGDLNGQGVGGIWWVVTPDGEKITDEVSQSQPASRLGY